MSDGGPMRPAVVCGYLLAALDASEGRRRKRKRDTTPDAIGMDMKRQLLEAAVREDPEPDAFEGWLLTRSLAAPDATGPVRAMALAVLAECRLARESVAFSAWLTRGAPSDDAAPG
jgi:hypothetical protein